MIGGVVFMMILFAILVTRHVVTANGGAVLLALILLNNTMYLVFLMLFLGYGLVAFPMSLWQRGNLLGELKRSEHKAAARYKYLGDATIVMGTAVADVMKTNEAVLHPTLPTLDSDRLKDSSRSIPIRSLPVP
jgi:hypothetical protein